MRSQARNLCGHRFCLSAHPQQWHIVKQPETLTNRRKPAVRVIFPQHKAILRTRGKHAIWLTADSTCNEVIDHHTDIGLVATQNEAVSPTEPVARH